MFSLNPEGLKWLGFLGENKYLNLLICVMSSVLTILFFHSHYQTLKLYLICNGKFYHLSGIRV